MARKVGVKLDVHFNMDGKMLPKAIRWQDGRLYDIHTLINGKQNMR